MVISSFVIFSVPYCLIIVTSLFFYHYFQLAIYPVDDDPIAIIKCITRPKLIL